ERGARRFSAFRAHGSRARATAHLQHFFLDRRLPSRRMVIRLRLLRAADRIPLSQSTVARELAAVRAPGLHGMAFFLRTFRPSPPHPLSRRRDFHLARLGLILYQECLLTLFQLASVYRRLFAAAGSR